MNKKFLMILVCIIIFVVVVLVLSYNKNKINEKIKLSDNANDEIDSMFNATDISSNSNENNGIQSNDNVNESNAENTSDAPKLVITLSDIGDNEKWMNVSCNTKYGIGEMDGYELYRSTSKDGEYELINTRYYGTANAGFGDMQDTETMYYYKLREFKQDENDVNNKTYTAFSNVVGPVNKDYKN